MNKLMCRFVTTTQKKKEKEKIPNANLDTACPAGIPCKNGEIKGNFLLCSPLHMHMKSASSPRFGPTLVATKTTLSKKSVVLCYLSRDGLIEWKTSFAGE